MLRTVAAVVVGYLTTAVWAFLSLSLAWVILGAGFAFAGDGPRISTGWTLVMLVLSLIGAVLGGWVASIIGRGPRAAVVLAVVILVLGFAMAIYSQTLNREAEGLQALAGRSPADIPMLEATSVAVPPAWYEFLLPLVGAAGAVYGGRLRRHPSGAA